VTKGSAFLDRRSASAHTNLREQKKIRAGAAALEKGQSAKRKRAHSLRSESDHDSRPEVEDPRAISALARLVHALGEEGIRFQVAGMSAAILQGTPATTLDTDLWVELPERQFVRLYAIVQRLSGSILAPTVAALSDDSIVNFLPRVDGLKDFAREYPQAIRLKWQDTEVAVLSLRKIIKSKEFLARPKDLAHLPLLRQTVRLMPKRRKLRGRSARGSSLG
jgi:hypothetical protein